MSRDKFDLKAHLASLTEDQKKITDKHDEILKEIESKFYYIVMRDHPVSLMILYLIDKGIL